MVNLFLHSLVIAEGKLWYYILNSTGGFHYNYSQAIVDQVSRRVEFKLIDAKVERKLSNSDVIEIKNWSECDDENELFLSGNGNFLKLFNAILQDDSFFRASGKNSLQTYLPKLDQQEQLILVHNTVSTDEDIRLAHSLKKELYWCLCPNANRYIENKLPDIPMMMKNDCTMVLGTDSLASNHELSILAEIQTIQHYFPLIPLEEMLRWATSNGANALGMQHTLGSFEKGKKPGMVQVENVVSRDRLPENLGISLKA